ncbi:MAG: flagellar export chaperone FlgN [Candidatus Eisenbacteria bacterium]|nr:flagellar export chaperone FlgN [Candidatus Eisenbacteria bacterium]
MAGNRETGTAIEEAARAMTQAAAPAAHGSEDRRGVDDLISLLQRETRLIIELREVLIRQRAAVGAQDPDGVQASIEGVGRIVTMLAEARTRRSRAIQSLGISPSPSTLSQLETALGVDLPLPLLQARAALTREARSVVTEVSINRTVLRRAVETGEAFLQALFSCLSDPSPVYQAAERTEPRIAAPSVLLDRVV